MQLGDSPNLIENQETDWLSILQLVFSLLLVIGALSIALTAYIGNIFLTGNSLAREIGVSPGPMLLVFASTALVIALIALVSAICAGRTKAGKPMPAWAQAKMGWLYGIILVLPVLLLLGMDWFRVPKQANTWMPIFTVISILFAGVWYMRIGIGRDWGKSPQRGSGLLTFSFGFTTPLILITEILAMGAFGLVFYLLTVEDPAMQQIYANLPKLLQGLQGDSQDALKLVQELAAKPAVIFSAIFLISFLMPLIEESLKTFGVLLLKGRGLSPREGILAGIYCGAGFGILEGMLFTVQAGSGMAPETWAVFVIGRAAALVLHIFNGALNGYALARFWQERKSFAFFGTFLLTLIIHGTWNLIAVLAVSNLLDQRLSGLLTTSIFMLVLIGYLVFSRQGQKLDEKLVINNGL